MKTSKLQSTSLSECIHSIRDQPAFSTRSEQRLSRPPSAVSDIERLFISFSYQPIQAYDTQNVIIMSIIHSQFACISNTMPNR